MSDQPVTFVIETAFGIVERTIPAASPLPAGVAGGGVVEDAIRDAAAIWGLPDFVFQAEIVQKGQASRQVGDNLLVVGDLGMVVQAKRREAPSGEDAKEARWLLKNAARALNQADGTIRTLTGTRLLLTNHRGRSIEVDGSAIRWLGVAVLDHPDVPRGVLPDTEGGANQAIALSRRDWEFLYDQLKSTHAVARYIERVAGESWELGAEAGRYFQLAMADAHTPPGEVDTDVLGPGGRLIGGPQLPLKPAASGGDELPLLFLRSLFEDIATGPLAGVTEENRLQVLAELDRLAVGTRAAMGSYLLKSMELAAADPSGAVIWRHRQYTSLRSTEDARPLHLAFATCSHEWDNVIHGMFVSWLSLRHHQMGERLGGHDDLVTVGVAVTPRSDGRRPWDTSLIAVPGHLELTPDEITQYESFWPISPDELEL